MFKYLFDLPATYNNKNNMVTLLQVMSFDVRYLIMRCVKCGSSFPFDPFIYSCPKCGGLLEVEGYDNPTVFVRDSDRLPGIWRYHEALPTTSKKPWVSLDEGGTPLVRVPGTNAWVKFEGSNPTGSFKDRGMAVAINIAKYYGARIALAASTGNTAASLAAYSARAGLKSIIVVPRGGIAAGKLFQSLLHGSLVVEVDGVFDDALETVLNVINKWKKHAYLVNSVNPTRVEGQKTIAYEIVEKLREAPDYVIVPVGNAGNISAIWKGFKELREWGYIDSLPRMIGVQAERSAPLYQTWIKGGQELIKIANPTTLASAIRIGKPVNWMKAIRALKESKGFMTTVTDKEIIEAVKEVARKVGLGVEPSSATPYAAWKKLLKSGELSSNDNIVLIATGHALKDPSVINHINSATTKISSADDLDNIIKNIANGVE